MKSLKPPLSIISALIVAVAIIVFVGGGIVSSSCNGKLATIDTAAIMAVKCRDCPTGAQQEASALFGKYLDTLTMSSADYTTLRNTFPSSGSARSKLVFQFFFKNSLGETPSLIAYASKPGNQFTTPQVPVPVSRVLNKAGRSTVQLPNEFVMGDQQIRFDDIDGIIGAATSYTLYFIPKIVAGERNIRYSVCIDKGSGVICLAPPPDTQPSPPANAN